MDQESGIRNTLPRFQQNKLTVDPWLELERFNTKVDIWDTLGVNQKHHMALEHVPKELYNKRFEDLTDPQDIDRVTLDAKE